jgi:hypothetical protein
MPQDYINFTGHVFQDDGDPVSGATVQLLETGTTTVEASTTTNSDGKWTFAEADQDEYDVKITSGTSVRYIRWDDEISVQELDVRNNASATTPAATFSNVTNSTSNQVAIFRSANSTRADNDEIYLSFELANSAGDIEEFARMTAVATDVTDGNEDSQIEFDVRKSGNLTKVWTITSSDAGAMSFDMNVDALTIGSGADTDISLTFDANSADGVITWMEDEDYFKFSDEILMNSTEKILFGDTGTFIQQSSDGVLTITSDTTVDINGAVVFDGAITGATTIDATTDFTVGSTVITDDSIVMTPSASDTVTIAGATNGILNITTVDAAGTAADVNIDADGEIVIDAADAAGSIFKIAGTAQLSIIDGSILPTTDNDIDLGSSSYQFKDAYINGTLEADAVTIGGTNVVTGSLVTTLGTISAGVWNGTAITGAYINDDIISGQSEITSGLAAADELLYSDAGTVKRVGIDTLTTYLAGVNAGTVTSTGLSDSSGVISLDIQNMTASTTIADADLIVIDDGAGGTLRKMTRANFIESAALDAINIDGGAIDGTAIGANSATTIIGTTIDATTDFTIGDTVITDGVITDSTGLQLAANLDIDGTADISGDLTLSGGADGALQFTNAGENSIKIPDNQASALIIEEANNAYITFVTTNSSEAITVAKATTFSAGIANSGTIAAGTWNGTAIASSYIAADAITGAKIADDAIDSEHYTDGSIDNAHIADDAIDSEHYAAGSIDTAHIADDQVTLAKMAGLARGKLIYGDSSGNPAALAVGSADQVLTHDGTDLAWADAGGGGGGTASFTADGSIAAGEAVGLTAAGKVTSITGMGPQYKTDDMPVADFYEANGSMQGDLVWCGSTGKVAFVGFWGSLSSYGYVTIGEYSTTTKAITWGTPVIFHSGNISLSVQAVWDENVDRLVILYPNSSDDAGTSLVYQISATGNTVVVSDGGGEYAPGTAQTFEAGATKNITADFDSNANKIIIFYEDDADSDYGKAVIGTVTGGSTNTMANTTAEKYNGNNASYGNCVKWDYDNGKGLLAFMDGGDSNYTKCVAFTHDGTNYTFGTIIEPFGANQLVYIADGHRVSNSVSFDSSNDNFVIVGGWADGDGDDVMRAVAVSVSGTTCTAGTAVVVTDKPQGDDGTQDVVPLEDGAAIEYDPDRDVHVLLVPEFSKNLPDLTRGDDGRMGDNSYVYGAYPLTLSGTGDRTTNVGTRFSASGAMWLSIAPWSSGSAQYRNLAYDTTNNVMHFITSVDGISTGGEATTMKPAISTFHGSTNALAYAQSTMDKFIGFNTSAVSDGASATITVKGGINENQSSLTVGQHYYISDDGKLTTTKPWASQFLYRAGIATAATKLIVLNDWYGG